MQGAADIGYSCNEGGGEVRKPLFTCAECLCLLRMIETEAGENKP